ncbi:MAG: hypothetical protein KDD52_05900 [Bdellovibrionales bacterium]|nr:hypothetical protein [Bdellovibrionales bacterium]
MSKGHFFWMFVAAFGFGIFPVKSSMAVRAVVSAVKGQGEFLEEPNAYRASMKGVSLAEVVIKVDESPQMPCLTADRLQAVLTELNSKRVKPLQLGKAGSLNYPELVLRAKPLSKHQFQFSIELMLFLPEKYSGKTEDEAVQAYFDSRIFEVEYEKEQSCNLSLEDKVAQLVQSFFSQLDVHQIESW